MINTFLRFFLKKTHHLLVINVLLMHSLRIFHRTKHFPNYDEKNRSACYLDHEERYHLQENNVTKKNWDISNRGKESLQTIRFAINLSIYLSEWYEGRNNFTGYVFFISLNSLDVNITFKCLYKNNIILYMLIYLIIELNLSTFIFKLNTSRFTFCYYRKNTNYFFTFYT